MRDVLCLSTPEAEVSSFFDLSKMSLRVKQGGDSRWREGKEGKGGSQEGSHMKEAEGSLLTWGNQTLHATLWGQFFPKPRGGEIVRTTLYISL